MQVPTTFKPSGETALAPGSIPIRIVRASISVTVTSEKGQPDTANVVADGGRTKVAIVTDGPCITETLQALEDGAATGKPMPRPALERAVVQASSLLERIVEAYEVDVAAGEVGASGCGRARFSCQPEASTS